jgi:hypothetical protein
MMAIGFMVGWFDSIPSHPASRSRLLALLVYRNRLMAGAVGSHIGVVVLSVGAAPLPEIIAAAPSAVAAIGSCRPGVELVEGLVFSTPLAASVLNPVNVFVVLAQSLVIVVVPGCRNDGKVGEVVVERVTVSVVDFVSIWDRAVCLFPQPSVGELPALLTALLPAHVFAASVDSSPHG